MDRYYLEYSTCNGLGHPSVDIFLTGCDKPIKCKGCHNLSLQQRSDEDINMEKFKDDLLFKISNFRNFFGSKYIAIMGGEPLSEENKKYTKYISEWMKSIYPDCIIVLYTWRELDDISVDKLDMYIENIDCMVMGEYQEDNHIDDILPASTNQFIFDNVNKEIIPSINLKISEDNNNENN